jgi:hypothetical protein
LLTFCAATRTLSLAVMVAWAAYLQTSPRR